MKRPNFTIYSYKSADREIGEVIEIETYCGRLDVVKSVWNRDVFSSDEEIHTEHIIHLDPISTALLLKKFRAEDEGSLAEALGGMFMPYGKEAYEKIKEWFKESGIEYDEIRNRFI